MAIFKNHRKRQVLKGTMKLHGKTVLLNENSPVMTLFTLSTFWCVVFSKAIRKQDSRDQQEEVLVTPLRQILLQSITENLIKWVIQLLVVRTQSFKHMLTPQ